MKFKKCSLFVAGILIGGISMLGLTVYGDIANQVTAHLASHITFEFDGVMKPVPRGYTTLSYEGRTYVPARFIAEGLGAEVVWDEADQNIIITGPEKEELKEPEEQKPDLSEDEMTGEEEQEEEEQEEQEEEETRIIYDALPITYYDGDIRLRVQTIVIDDDQTRVFVSLLNEGNVSIQLDQSATVITIDGKEYKQLDTRIVNPYVSAWYNDIRKDDNVDSLVRMPVIPEDTEKLTIKFLVRENTLHAPQEKEVVFDIKL
ncbi:hypothetical protein Amet_0185 [Alkaliphilus metalliredigens QYMF]|uniref:Copper amine oxidase-like N-terminal domain-containing protein n=1 Tax=Alkaliphilus metalliredigens (strain QYMF) TaxID=293826 RepID=A6TJQ4_ALKMQ|nr:stalk domain-containing protein [Alkaliphilus metalliredigens]ABR46422.1 hypothetical protein Amet_0185 [Alkaliphilus metalliredigens QYMF]